MENKEHKTSNNSGGNTISAQVIKQRLDTRVVGSSLIYLDEVGSTNAEAKKLAEEGAVEGTVVIAGTQSAGRGRLGREWFSPRGGAWISVILRPPSMLPLQKLTLVGGLSAAKTINNLYGINAVLRWPNDVLVGGKKICGVIAEGAFEGESPLYIVMGIGINGNIDPQSFPEEIRTKVTSIQKQLRHGISLNELIISLLQTLDTSYTLFARGEEEPLMREYQKLCATIGQNVRIVCGEEIVEGRAKRITPDGALIVGTKGSKETTVLAGDCTHLTEIPRTKRKNIKGETKKLRQ